MYIIPILWMLTWPALIAVSYYIVLWAVKKYEKRIDDGEL